MCPLYFFDHSYNHCVKFFEVSSTVVLLEFVIVELLISGGIMLPFFFCSHVFLYWDACV
jgi:hypothetical protein